MGYKIPLFAAVGPSTTADGYAPMMNCAAPTNFTDEGSANTPFFEAGTLSNFTVNIWSNAATATSNFTLRKNSANGNQTIAVSAGGTGRFYDNTNTDTVANGDVVCSLLDRGGGGNLQVGGIGSYYETDSGIIVNKIGASGSSGVATGTSYINFIGDFSGLDNSAPLTPEITVAGTVKNFHAYSNTNTRTNVSTFRTRLNGADGNCVVTFAASSTGLRTDTTNSDSLAISDNFNYSRVTSAGSGTFTFRHIGCEIHYPANEFSLFTCDNGGVAITATTGRFFFPTGSFAGNGSESSAPRVKLKGSGVLSDMYYNTSANTGTQAATVDVRLNGSSAAITDTLPASTSGTRSDTTNTATFADDDDLNYRYLKSLGTGTATFRWFSLKVTYDIPVSDFTPQAIWFM
jgi:hypothetical protein